MKVVLVLVCKRFPAVAASYHLYWSPEPAPEAIKVAVDPMHIEAPVVAGAKGIGLTVILLPLSVPVFAGLLLITVSYNLNLQ